MPPTTERSRQVEAFEPWLDTLLVDALRKDSLDWPPTTPRSS
jgi:hypothetical protein